MFRVTLPTGHTISPALILDDMQNGFVSKGGSYDKIGMNTPNYREIIPKLDLIESAGVREFLSFTLRQLRRLAGLTCSLKSITFYQNQDRKG